MGHPVLAAPARPVADPTDPAVRRLLGDMDETLTAAGGIGLAAPQVAVGRRVILYEVPAARNDGVAVPRRAMINPVLVPLDPVDDGPAVDSSWEACLSLPGLSGLVPRARRVRVEALDSDGTPVAFEATGFHARVLQHECDHLDGVLYPQRMTDLSSFGFVDERSTASVAPAS